MSRYCGWLRNPNLGCRFPCNYQPAMVSRGSKVVQDSVHPQCQITQKSQVQAQQDPIGAPIGKKRGWVIQLTGTKNLGTILTYTFFPAKNPPFRPHRKELKLQKLEPERRMPAPSEKQTWESLFESGLKTPNPVEPMRVWFKMKPPANRG